MLSVLLAVPVSVMAGENYTVSDDGVISFVPSTAVPVTATTSSAVSSATFRYNPKFDRLIEKICRDPECGSVSR